MQSQKVLSTKIITAFLAVTFTLVSSIGVVSAQSPLTLGMISSDQAEDYLGDSNVKQQAYDQLLEYIASKLGNITTKIVTVDNISAMAELLEQQKVDLYLGSPFISALVDNKSKATPFLTMWPANNPHYNSLIVTRKDSPIIYHLYDLKGGKTIGFSDPQSNMGYLLPKSYLIDNGLKFSPPNPLADMFYIFTGGDNRTLSQVLNRTIDVGAIPSKLFDSLPSSVSSKLKVVGKSTDIPLSIISHRSDMDPGLVDQISNIINGVKTDPQVNEIFKRLNDKIEFKPIEEQLSANLTGMLTKAINGTESSYY